jgi:histone deacetylase 1/2
VLSGFFSTVTEEILTHIKNVPTARAAWVILERMFSSRSRARVIQIRSQLTSAKKKGVPAADYFRNMKMLADTLAAIGQPLKEEEVISYNLVGLGPNYDSLVTLLSVKDDLMLDEIYSHLLAYEHRHEVQDAEYSIGGGSSANFISRNQGRGNGGGAPGGHPGGRGGGNGGRGQGRGGGNGNGGRGNGGRNQGRGGNSGGNQGSHPVCQICNKVGHIALRCYSRFDHAYGGEEEHHSTNHATTSYQMDPNWYMDSGATDHITEDLERLHMRDGYNGNDRVQVGNGTCLHITHTCQSSINIVANSLVLNNVLRVPQISKNLLSVHKLAKDNGVSIIFYPYYFLIKDLETGRTLL